MRLTTRLSSSIQSTVMMSHMRDWDPEGINASDPFLEHKFDCYASPFALLIEDFIFAATVLPPGYLRCGIGCL